MTSTEPVPRPTPDVAPAGRQVPALAEVTPGAGAPVGVSAPIAPRDDLALMEGYHSPQVEVSVRLNTNESPYPPPPAWREVLLTELASLSFHRYPDRKATALRAAIGELHGVGPEQVFAANGSNEVLQTLCLTYAGAGRAVAVFEPTYALHSHIARITGARVVVGERQDNFALDLDEVRRVLTEVNPTITFLCSPNNPTGRVEPREVVEAVIEMAPGLVVVDEAYGQFAPWSALELFQSQAAESSPVVVVRTYSKTWSMAAARLGYCVAPAWMVAELEKVALPYHLDGMKQLAGRLALRFRSEMEARVAALVAERERVLAVLRKMALDVWPSGANFILFRPRPLPAPPHRDPGQAKRGGTEAWMAAKGESGPQEGSEVWRSLLERSVLVRDCSSWPRLQGCLRVTIGTPAENDAFLAALQEVLERA